MRQPKEKLGRSADIFVVIVLYGMAVEDSPTYRSLRVALASHSGLKIESLLFDNTPGRALPGDLPANFHYFASPANTGLATAYNMAAKMADARGIRWLLTLDQDSKLPPNFLSEFARLAAVHQDDERIGAIVPQILSGERLVSPNWFVRHTWPRWFPRGYCGVPKEAVYAFNSGALVRLEALQKIGGYSLLFWLDNCDHHLFRRFETFGLMSYVAGNVEIQHDFSMLDVGGKMSLTRYQNALEAGSAFCDMEFGWVARLEHTAVLLRRYLGQVLKRQPRDMRRLTVRMIRTRLLQPKARRVKDWHRVQQERIRGYGDIDLMPTQMDSNKTEEESQNPPGAGGGIANVLAVIVLYKTTMEASSTLNSLQIALRNAPQELRFKILVYDNSPATQTFLSPPEDISYVADSTNPGLSKPYNVATALAQKEGFDWILTLDQDTELRPDFLCRLTDIVKSIQKKTNVAAILPRVMEGERLLSPNWFLMDFFVRHFPSNFNGVAEQSGYGFNSAATVRVSTLQTIGGYSPLFPLDYSDAYLFRKLHLHNHKTYVAGDLVVEHNLSILHVDGMSAERYRNVMMTGSAFCDLMRGRLVGAEFTYRLVRAYLGQLIHGRGPEKKKILARLILDRLMTRKSTRIRRLAYNEETREAIRIAQA